MDRLMALQALARVVEIGGFTKAGDSMQLSKTTVSDLVQSLEKRLGVRLLQRTTRRVTVTPDGAAFYERCSHILAVLDEAWPLSWMTTGGWFGASTYGSVGGGNRLCRALRHTAGLKPSRAT